MAHCPSVAELVKNVKSLMRKNNGAFQDAWFDSFPDAYRCCEQGGFVYVGTQLSIKIGFTILTLSSNRFPSTQPHNQSMDNEGSGGNDDESKNGRTEPDNKLELSGYQNGQSCLR